MRSGAQGAWISGHPRRAGPERGERRDALAAPGEPSHPRPAVSLDSIRSSIAAPTATTPAAGERQAGDEREGAGESTAGDPVPLGSPHHAPAAWAHERQRHPRELRIASVRGAGGGDGGQPEDHILHSSEGSPNAT